MTPAQVLEALDAMMARHDDAFIVFTASNGRFFQFSGNEHQPLYFSFPLRQFTSVVEIVAIQQVMDEHEVQLHTRRLQVGPNNSTPAGSIREYGRHYGRNTHLASHLVDSLLATVPSFKNGVQLQRSWDLLN